MAKYERKHKFNLCKLVKSHLGPDIKYSNAVSRRTKKEHGFEVCELPKTKQWVAGQRRTGGAFMLSPQPCSSFMINSTPLKTVGSVHTHPKQKGDTAEHLKAQHLPSIEDVIDQARTGEKFTCISVPEKGTVHCYGKVPSKDVDKMIDMWNRAETQKAYNRVYNPAINKHYICKTQIEKVGKLKRVKEKIKKPKRPPLQF